MPESKRHPARRPTQRQAKPSHKPTGSSKSANSSSKATKAYSPGWRGSLERASVTPLFFLNTLPRLLVPAMLGIFMIMGLAMPWHWTGVFLLIPAIFLGWLLVLSWPLLSPSGRLARLVAVVGLFVGFALRVTGHLG